MSSPPEPLQQFAFANLKGNVCLVQVSVPPPGAASAALAAADVRVFRHEFITIFRYSHSTTVHPADLHVLERVDGLYDAGGGAVFLARDGMDRLLKLSAAGARRPPRAPVHVRTRMRTHTQLQPVH